MQKKKIDYKKDLELLKDLTLLSGVSGKEKPVRKYMENELQSIANKTMRDHLGSVAFEFKGSEDSPRVLLCGHMDEIGFMVHSISAKGMINFTNLGGWDPRTLMSSAVEIITREGKKIFGLIGSVPVHHLKDPGGKLSIDDMYIDIGAESDKEVGEIFGVEKGNFVVPIPNFHYIEEKDILVSKAFDDRVGVAVAIEAGKHFSNKNHPNTLICAGSVQEEVGTRGAQTVANLVKPDIAIVLEGAPGDDFPSNREESQAKMNAGVQLRLIDPTMIANPLFTDFAIKLAKENNIPLQIAVRKSGGTDAGKIHLSNLGVPTIVLAAPVRYAHSHNGMLSLYDYKAMKDLVFLLVERIDVKKLSSFVG